VKAVPEGFCSEFRLDDRRECACGDLFREDDFVSLYLLHPKRKPMVSSP
jgi:hypothetical protein